MSLDEDCTTRESAAPDDHAGFPTQLGDLRAAIAGFLRDERRAGRHKPRCDAWMRGFDRSFS